MTTHAAVPSDAEPTPQFDAACVDLINHWQRGGIGAQEVKIKLQTLAQDAALSGHVANQGRIEHVQGYIQFYLGNMNAALAHYDRARELWKQVGNRRRAATMDLNQGEIYRYKGEFRRARRLYRSSYEIALQLGDIYLQSLSITNEGLTLINLKDYARAKRALEEGYELSERWPSNKRDLYGLRCEIHQGLAMIALEVNKPANAWEYAQLALENAQHADEMLSIGFAYRSLGDALCKLDAVPNNATYQTAGDYYRAALEAFEVIDAQAEIARTKFQMAKDLAQNGRRRPAAKLFNQALAIFSQLGMTNDAAQAAEAQLQAMR